MKNRIVIIVIFILKIGYSQDSLDSTLFYLKKLNFSKANHYVKQIENEELKGLLQWQIRYYLSGNQDSIQNIDFNQSSMLDKRLTAIRNLLIADYYYLKKDIKQNRKIFESYFETIAIAKELKDTFLLSEGLRKINHHVLYRARDTLASKEYLHMYERYSSYSKLDVFWYNYISIGYQYMLTEKNIELADNEYIEFLFENAFSSVDQNSLPKGMLYQMKGIYQAHWLNDYHASNESNERAIKIYGNFPYWFARNKIRGLKYNTNINHYKNGDFRRPIPFFLRDLQRKKEPLLLMHTNEWLFKCYEGLKQYDSAHYYFKQMVKLKERMKQSENALVVRELSSKYNFEKKEQELAKLSKEKTKLQSNLYTLIPILGLVTLVLIGIFFLYRRYRKKSTVLEEEKSETLQKLDELKQIVVKNHIVLKDKTKVYITDLMYIKAEDHYLKLFLSNGKDHFVRGGGGGEREKGGERKEGEGGKKEGEGRREKEVGEHMQW